MTAEEKEIVAARSRRYYYKKKKLWAAGVNRYKKPVKKPIEERRLNIGYRASHLLALAKSRHKAAFCDPCTLTHAWVVEALKNGKCQRTGITFDLTKPENTHRNPFGPSIDRIDPHIGYIIENCQVVCNMYNTGKGQHTDEQFIKFCHIVASKNPITDDMIDI